MYITIFKIKQIKNCNGPPIQLFAGNNWKTRKPKRGDNRTKYREAKTMLAHWEV